MVRTDYSRLRDFTPTAGVDPDGWRVAAAMGVATVQLVVDDRGLVVWSSFDLR